MVVEQELGKVPLDGSAKGACQLCLEELEDGVSISTVDVDLGEDREGGVVRRRRKLEDLLVGAGFLLSKLCVRSSNRKMIRKKKKKEKEMKINKRNEETEYRLGCKGRPGFRVLYPCGLDKGPEAGCS